MSECKDSGELAGTIMNCRGLHAFVNKGYGNWQLHLIGAIAEISYFQVKKSWNI